jgi:hypothetical protein
MFSTSLMCCREAVLMPYSLVFQVPDACAKYLPCVIPFPAVQEKSGYTGIDTISVRRTAMQWNVGQTYSRI